MRRTVSVVTSAPASLVVLVFTCAVALAAAPAPAPVAGAKAPTDPATEPFSNLEMRNIGPAIGGRVSRVTGVPGDPRVYLAATAMGGVWRSSDGGHKWSAVFDDQPTHSMGSIAVAPSDPNVVYAGSGEANIRGNVAAGNGIYKSTDGGKTWEHVWKQEGQIGTMAVHPTNPDVAFAAVLGHAFGPNPERGVYRTTDGGKTWTRVLFKDADTGASDVCLDPSNPRVVFAGFWQTRRRPWELTSGGPGSSLYVSRDGGDTWKQLSASGLPEGIWGRVAVRVAPSDGRRVYALIEAEAGGLFRSDDGGESWQLVNKSRGLRQRPWYFTALAVDPNHADVVWFPQVPMLKTIDGGKTIRPVEGGGWDYHDVWIDPRDTRRMIVASDAGVSLSLDGGETWRRPPLPITQHYHVSVDTRKPYWVYVSAQDYGTVAGPSNSLDTSGIALGHWHWAGGGEAGHVVSDPEDPDIVYAGEYLGYISRYDHRSTQARNVSAYPENLSGHGIVDGRYRFQWTAPILISPHDAKTVYHAANVLFRSRDGGQTWSAISPDLTRDDESKQQWSGGPITGDNTGVEFYGTLFALAESRLEKGLLWAGSDDGLVHVSRGGSEGSATWQNVTAAIPSLPEWATVTTIEASPHAAGTAYLVADAHRLDDMRPYLWKTTDHGRSWKAITAGLDARTYLHVVREDPWRKDLLYLGTERGLQASWDGGASWKALDLDLPTVAVQDLVVTEHDLVVGTFGRSVWIFDDLTPVRAWAPALAAKAVHLFPAAPATRWRQGVTASEEGSFSNPPRGLVLHYWLKEKAAGELVVEIRDAHDRRVRRLSSTPVVDWMSADDPDQDPDYEPPKGLPTDAGLHRVVWDLRWDAPQLIPHGRIDWGNPGNGPLAIPGPYTVRLSVGGQTLETAATIEPDPRVRGVSAADLETQLAFALDMRETMTRLTRGVARLRSAREQLNDRAVRLGERADAKDFVSSCRTLAAKLDDLEKRLHNPTAEVTYDILAMRGGAKLYSRLSPLFSFVNEGDGAPTQGMREVFAGQKAELEGLTTELDRLLGEDLRQIEDRAKALGLGLFISPAH